MTYHIYTPETHDPILRRLSRTLSGGDQEIADRMGFSKSTIQKQRARLALANNRGPRPPMKFEENPKPPKSRPNPLQFARIWLGKRLAEKPSGYRLDGVPVNLDPIMQAANRAAKKMGAEQLGFNPSWLQ